MNIDKDADYCKNEQQQPMQTRASQWPAQKLSWTGPNKKTTGTEDDNNKRLKLNSPTLQFMKIQSVRSSESPLYILTHVMFLHVYGNIIIELGVINPDYDIVINASLTRS